MKMLEDLEEVARMADFDSGDITSCISSWKFLAIHHATIRDLAKRLEECEQECLEQARLLGMGSEREAALMARLEVAEMDAARYRWLSKRTRIEARDGGYNSSYCFYPVARHDDSFYKGAIPFFHKTIDAAIDAAMQEAGR